MEAGALPPLLPPLSLFFLPSGVFLSEETGTEASMHASEQPSTCREQCRQPSFCRITQRLSFRFFLSSTLPPCCAHLFLSTDKESHILFQQRGKTLPCETQPPSSTAGQENSSETAHDASLCEAERRGLHMQRQSSERHPRGGRQQCKKQEQERGKAALCKRPPSQHPGERTKRPLHSCQKGGGRVGGGK